MKDWFDMTRHARRGMVAMLVAIALVLLVTVVFGSHREPVPQRVVGQDTSLLDAKTDTLSPDTLNPVRKESARQQSRRHPQRRPAKPSPSREPRPLDPVPAF